MNADRFLSFIGTRLREEERLALAAAKEGHPDWEAYNRRPDPDPYPDWRLAGPDADGFGDRAASAQHAALHDPARVLRQVERDRRILDRHTPHSMGECRVCEAPHWGVQVCNHCYGQRWPCPDVLDLAAPFAEHSDYRDEWRPA